MNSLKIAHFELIERIGAGGSGEVFLARDIDLDRNIALKLLSKGRDSDDRARDRFLREARAIAKLNHHGIVTCYEVGHHENQTYIAMEHVDGKALDDVIARDKPNLETSVKIAIELAEALGYAHAREVIHRDVKPQNILITKEGHAKVADFGLAHLTGADRLTASGDFLGTFAYMSPEQVCGESVDHRSDVFSLGVVLYELLTGVLPFQGRGGPELFYAITNKPPRAMSDFTTSVPHGLEATVRRMLSKKPGARHQSMQEVAADLQPVADTALPGAFKWKSGSRLRSPLGRIALAVASLAVVTLGGFGALEWFGRDDRISHSGQKRIAVLSFENVGNPDHEDIIGGLTDEINAKLSRMSYLEVTASTSARKYRESEVDLRSIARQLDVDYVLTGRARWESSQSGSPGRVRITPRLIDGNDITQIWSESYDRRTDSVFAMQAEIAANIVQALHAALRPSVSTNQHPHTVQPDAYEFYLKGNEYMGREGDEEQDLLSAIKLYDESINRDSSFAHPRARKSVAYSALAWWHTRSESDRLVAERLAREALAIQPSLIDAHIALGYHFYWGRGNYEKAISEFELVLAEDPDNAEVLKAKGLVKRRQGDFKSAVQYLQRASQIDPRSAEKAWELGNTFCRLRRWDEARDYLVKATSIAPDMPDPYSSLVQVYINQFGNTNKARAVLSEATRSIRGGRIFEDWILCDLYDRKYGDALQRLTSVGEDTLWYLIHRGQVLRLAGEGNDAVKVFDSCRAILEALVKVDPQDESRRQQLSIAYAGLGHRERALQEANKAISLYPVGRDAFYRGPTALENLSLVYAMLDEDSAAVSVIEQVLAMPAGMISIQFLQLDPRYAKVVAHPAFARMRRRLATA